MEGRSGVSELEFLRDQVQRLEVCLAQYQEKFRPIATVDEGELPAKDAPWNSNYQILSPLLVEYDRSISELAADNEQLRADFVSCKRNMEAVLAENRALVAEIKDDVKNEMRAAEATNVSESTDDVSTTEMLQQQLGLALVEKEAMAEMWRAACAEVDRLEKQVDVVCNNPQWKLFQEQTTQVKDQYYQAAEEMTQEVDRLQDELRRTKSELRTAMVQVSDLRQTMDELRKELLLQDKVKQEMMGEGALFHDENEAARRKLTDLESRHFSMETELEKLRVQNNALNETCKEYQTKCVDLEQKVFEANLKVHDSVQLVENAVLERDQVRIREQQLLEDNRKLQDAMSKVLEESAQKAKEEIDNVKTQCNINLERMTEELYNNEMENSERSIQIERMIREKKMLEAELEKCYREGLSRGTSDESNLLELRRRACQAETDREEAIIKMDNMQNQLKRSEINRTQEGAQLQSQCKQLRDRCDTMTSELERLNQERLLRQDDTDALRKQLQLVQKEKEAVERKWRQELICIEQDRLLKEREFEVKLQGMEDSNRQSLLEVRRHYSSQQKMAAKWKVECENITAAFEKKVAELRDEVTRLKQRNQELGHLLSASNLKAAETKKMMSEYARNVQRMDERIRMAEHKALMARQVARPLYRDVRAAERPFSPLDSDGQRTFTNEWITEGSPVHLYATDDSLNGTR